MIHKVTLLLATILLVCCKDRTEKLNNEAPIVTQPNYDCEISIMVGGDLMFHQPQIDAALDVDGGYTFAKSFQYISDSWNDCDAVIFNLETTLSESKYSGYPRFAAPMEVALDLKRCGVTHLVLANNHVCDKSAKGIENTLKYLSQADIQSCGSYVDSTEWEINTPLFIKKEGFNIALLNYTYDTNGLPIPKGMVVPLLDTLQMKADIAKAQRGFATNIIVFVHWGNEYQSYPSKEQKEMAAWLHSKGVDIVVGSHPHVIQPTNITANEVTIYSLGNLISNQRKRYTNGGLLVKLDITRNIMSGRSDYKITHYPHFVYKAPLGDTPRYYCIPQSLVDSVINDPTQLNEAKLFFSDTHKLLGL